jgi:DinB superfamily
MNANKHLSHFQNVVTTWEKDLDKYTLEQLLIKPAADSWSMGQVYNHLISATLFFHLKQVETCLASNENADKSKNFKGFLTYNVLGKMPPIKIKVPPSDAYTPKQPESLEAIKKGLTKVQERMKETATILQSKSSTGKTAHPGLSYLNAEEWYRLVGMHFTHHLRQKETLDAMLAK